MGQTLLNYSIAVGRDLDGAFTYTSSHDLELGQLVLVDFRGKETVGLVIDRGKADFDGKLKDIAFILPYKIPAPYLQFAKFAADYNLIKFGNVFKLMAPFSADAILAPEKEPRERNVENPQDVILNKEQSDAVEKICCYIGEFKTVLLHGITGSGKTEVFLEVAKKILERGYQQILILVPEVALSSELSQKVASRLGCDVFTWHHTVSPSRKLNIWKKAINGDKMIVVGARSALFIPFENLGGIIIDEEHDGSFKQNETTIYNARDMAIYLGYCKNIPVILSSATPSVESYNNVISGKYEYVKLKSRYFENATLPSVIINDLKKEKLSGTLSEYSIMEIRECMRAKKQALIFINRRGHTPKILCRSCGERVTCPACSTWLCYHHNTSELVCHYCGHRSAVRNLCSSCKSPALIGVGSGIEKVYEECLELFPNARIMMFSSDTASTPNRISKAIAQIKNGEVDIILGTQIVAKGHNFDNLNLVVVTCVDAMLYGEDFRSIEKAFQTLYQVSGRAGRVGNTGSKVIIQTYNPDEKLMTILEKNDVEQLYSLELQNRKLTGMPPFGKMASITISALSENEVKKFTQQLLRSMPHIPGIKVLGAIQPSLYKLNSRYRLKILLLSQSGLQSYIKSIDALSKIPRNIKVSIDITPHDFA